jgi:hypothetical protein
MALDAAVFDAFSMSGLGAHQQTMQHAANGAQRQADGAQTVAEVLRFHSVGMLDQADARAGRVTDESGSGRAREIGNPTVK